MSQNPRNRLLEILKTLAYEEREVILASGKPSNFYIDCKQAVLTAEGHFLVGWLVGHILAFILSVIVAAVLVGYVNQRGWANR